MNDDDRRTVCEELKHMVKAWRAITQDKHDSYIGKWVPSYVIQATLTWIQS